MHYVPLMRMRVRVNLILIYMDTFNRLPWAAQNAVFKRLSEISELSELTREERIRYDAAIRQYRDHIYVMEGEKAKGRAEGLVKGRAEGLVEGRAEGRAEGLAEGERNGALKFARYMRQEGKRPEEIAAATGLSLAEIENLE